MSLPVIRTGDVPMDRFLEQVRLFIDTAKGDIKPQDRVLRFSDMAGIVAATAAAAQKPLGNYTQQDVEKLAQDLANTRLFQSLMRPGSALDGIVDGLPRTVLSDVRAVAGKGRAAVTSEAIVSTTNERALAARIDTVSATLTGLEGDIASVEVAYLALADSVDGLEAQYTVKVTAGGAVAGFGLAATSPVGGTPSSAFIISADKFAIVSPSYAGGLTNFPTGANMPFSVDADGVYVNGRLNLSSVVSVAGANTFSIKYGSSTYGVQSPCHFNLGAASTGLAYSAQVGKTSGVGYFQFGITGMAEGLSGSGINVGVNGHGSGGAGSYGGAFYGDSADIFLAGSRKIDWGTAVVGPPSGNVGDVLRGNGTWGAVSITSAAITAALGYTPVGPLGGVAYASDAGTVGGLSTTDIANFVTGYVQDQAACRSGATFTLNIPGVGSWSGCQIF